MTRPTVIIVGAGISGLATAWYLRNDARVIVIEAAEHPGGKIATATFRGQPLDLGPDAFIVRNTAAVDLCAELGITDQLIEPSTRSAAIYSRRHLHPFPEGLVFGIPTNLRALYRSRIVAPTAVLRALRDRLSRTPAISDELARRIEQGGADPTVAEVFSRPFGRSIVSALIDPLVGGINAGDASTLSFVAAMPQIFDAIIARPSVSRALGRRATSATSEEGSIFRGLAPGLAFLTECLVSKLEESGVEIVCGEAVTCIGKSPAEGYVTTTGTTRYNSDALVLATPAWVSARLVADLSQDLSCDLWKIPYASVAIVTLAFDAAEVPRGIARDLRGIADARLAPDDPSRSLPGSGVLVARDAGLLTTATSFTSSKWPRSHREGEVVIRVSLGRHLDDRLASMDDEELVGCAREELRAILGIDAAPLEVLVRRWTDSFPQYVSGHRSLVQRIDQRAGELGLGLVGAAYRGIGIPACIAEAKRFAADLIARDFITPRPDTETAL